MNKREKITNKLGKKFRDGLSVFQIGAFNSSILPMLLRICNW